jgi:SIR2-like domain/Caspase domain
MQSVSASSTRGSSVMAQLETMPARRDALIVAADHYEDRKLRALNAPARDAAELARVLGDPEIGDFRIDVSLNDADNIVRRKVSEFFHERGRNDLLLLHLSCHGIKDEDGTLYFASSNTALEHLEATAVSSAFIHHQMTKSRSRRMILLFDCCFSGAFARGLVHRASSYVGIKEEFEGQGRVILTASGPMGYAFEGDNVASDGRPSIFTSAIVEGLETGEADLDRDGHVSVDELFDYLCDRVHDATPNQTPRKWVFDVQGNLYVARSPFRGQAPVLLPELRMASESPYTYVRAGAVEELTRLLTSPDVSSAAAARIMLEELANDDSKLVSAAAARALDENRPPESTQAVLETTRESQPPATAPVRLLPPPRKSQPSDEQLHAHWARVARKIVNGLVVPFLGAGINLSYRPTDFRWSLPQDQYLPSSSELARYLSSEFGELGEGDDLARVAQFASITEGTGSLYQALHEVFAYDYPPGPVHRLLADLQRTLGNRSMGSTPHQVIMTTNYDDMLERAFDAAGEEYDLLTYISMNPAEHRGRFMHLSPEADEPQPITHPYEYQGVDLSRRTVILKMYGGVARSRTFDEDNYVITEDDFSKYLSHSDISQLLPPSIAKRVRNSHFLFLGYGMNAWSVRVLFNRIWGERGLDFPSWSIQYRPDVIETRVWEDRNVQILDVDLYEYVEGLRRTLLRA